MEVKVLLAELKACRKLERGKTIHAEAIESGNHSSIYVATGLIKMYAQCGSMIDAHHVFESIKHPDVVTWTALISGYAENGEGVFALELLASMKFQGCAPDSYTYVAALKACTSLALKQDGDKKAECLEKGKLIHSEINCHWNVFVHSALIEMYAKCGSMNDALHVFDSIKHPDVVSWNVIISGYAENGEGGFALDLFARMRSQGCTPNSRTFTAALKACTSLAVGKNESERAKCLECGKRVHLEIGCHIDIQLQTSLIDMYSKCGSMHDALSVFSDVKRPDVASWNALILGYAENGEGVYALDLFARMKSQGFGPNYITYLAALKACTSLAQKQDKKRCLEEGKQIHFEIGCHSNVYVQSTLIDMYAKCGSMLEARKVFDDMKHPNVVSWTVLILGYVENGEAVTALDLFSRMKSQGFTPNSITILAALKACTTFVDHHNDGKAECLRRGKKIHSDIGWHLDIYVQSTLIEMYAKCGSMIESQLVFDSIKNPDVVLWNNLILGYADNGKSVVSLDLYARMRSQGCRPNPITFVAALKASGSLGALECGSKVHAEMIDAGIELDVILITCLVDFYAKCGNLMEARKVFDLYPTSRDLTTWTALLAGYSRLGYTEDVFELFKGMQDVGFKPNDVTFLCILTCFSHAGLVEKAREFFQVMSNTYRVVLTTEHYNCMLDILGRSDKLDDAIALLSSMPCMPNAWTWVTILGACCKWKNLLLGRLAFMCLVSLDDTDASAYVLMAHIYRSKGMWEEHEMVLQMKLLV